MARAKRHHFVPRVLQRSFSIDGERIWYSERKPNGRFSVPEMRNLTSAFMKKDYYTVYPEGKPSDTVEVDFYGAIDNYLGAILPQVFSSFKEGRIPRFKGESFKKLCRVVYEVMKRTPDFVKTPDDLVTGREAVTAIINGLSSSELAKDRQRLAELSSIEKSEVAVRQIGRDIRVNAIILKSENVLHALDHFSVRWAIIEGSHSYILSGLMAYRIGNGGPNGVANPNMEIWMPLSPKIAMVLVRDTQERIPHRVIEDRDHVRSMNEYAVRNSNYLGSHSDRLLRSLISLSTQ